MGSITRGAKFMKPAPRSSSWVMTRVILKVRVPSRMASPTRTPSASSKGGSTHTVPASGIVWTGAPAASRAVLTLTVPRSG